MVGCLRLYLVSWNKKLKLLSPEDVLAKIIVGLSNQIVCIQNRKKNDQGVFFFLTTLGISMEKKAENELSSSFHMY